MTLQCCGGFCHTFTWISHGCTLVPHPETPPSSVPTPSLWVVPQHQLWCPASCIQFARVTYFTYVSRHFGAMFGDDVIFTTSVFCFGLHGNCTSSSQLWLTLCDPMDRSPPGASVRGIFQARILGWVVISFSRRSFLPRDWTQVFCIAGRLFIIWATSEANIRKLYFLLWSSIVRHSQRTHIYSYIFEGYHNIFLILITNSCKHLGWRVSIDSLLSVDGILYL